MFLGQFKQMFKGGKEEEEPAEVQKPPEQQKSSDSDEFMKTPEAKKFVEKWSEKKRDGKPLYTKRGIVALLKALFQIPGLSSNKEVLTASEELLTKLGGMDGLQGFLMGWKVKSEGIIKGLKTIMGAK